MKLKTAIRTLEHRIENTKMRAAGQQRDIDDWNSAVKKHREGIVSLTRLIEEAETEKRLVAGEIAELEQAVAILRST